VRPYSIFYTLGKQSLRIEFPDYLGRDIGHLLLCRSVGCKRRKKEEERRRMEEKKMIRNRRIRRKNMEIERNED